MEKLELSDSPEFAKHAEVACSVEDTESLLLDDHTRTSNKAKQYSSLSESPSPPLLPIRPTREVRSHSYRTPETPILSAAMDEQ